MLSDCEILGLAQTDDITAIKKAYRARVKTLHPDVINDVSDLKNHYLFVEVCKAYERLVCKSKDNDGGKGRSTQSHTDINNGIQKHKDPSYVYYKSACKYYETVHPTHWNLDQTITVNGKTREDNELQEETKDKVRIIAGLLPKAYYYFSVVVHEYPESVWAQDAQEKMLLIEKRMRLYRKILESFNSWNNI